MGFLDFFKNKEGEPFHHKNEKNIILKDGKHYVIGCENVIATKNAVIIESEDSSYKEISGKARVQIFKSGKVELLRKKANIGYFQSGFITKIKNKASITTVHDCIIQYMKDKSKIGTFNNGLIKFLDDKSSIQTFNDGEILNTSEYNAQIGTLIKGKIANVIDKTKITTIMNGEVNYVTEKSYIGTINNGRINNVCDKSKIATLNNGTIGVLMGESQITTQISGKVEDINGNSKIVYDSNSPKPVVETKKEKKKKVEQNAEVIEADENFLKEDIEKQEDKEIEFDSNDVDLFEEEGKNKKTDG